MFIWNIFVQTIFFSLHFQNVRFMNKGFLPFLSWYFFFLVILLWTFACSRGFVVLIHSIQCGSLLHRIVSRMLHSVSASKQSSLCSFRFDALWFICFLICCYFLLYFSCFWTSDYCAFALSSFAKANCNWEKKANELSDISFEFDWPKSKKLTTVNP